jgi:hypothetical protein
MANAIKVFIWFILAIITVDIGFEFISMASSFFNFLGVTIVFVFTLISIKTKCLTSLKLKQDEKN